MKFVYIVFSHTNTVFGRMIRIFTRNKYNHVSLALTPRLDALYSFGRIKKASPLKGSFIIETPARFLDGGKDVPLKIARLELEDAQYQSMLLRLKYAKTHRDLMLYNHYGAAASLFERQISIKDSYVCFEFVAELLGLGGVANIRQFERRVAGAVFYEGSFREFTSARNGDGGEYFQPESPIAAAGEALSDFGALTLRVMHG